MKKLFLLVLVFNALLSVAQNNARATENFVVSGLIQKELIIDLSFLENFSIKSIPDVVITNHKGEAKGTAKMLSVVSLKDILKEAELTEDSPKRFSEFYLTFIASDNYKAVYSWNEIFNSPVGDNLFIVVAKDGVKLREMKERILVITPSDYNTGRRYIKGLSKIVFSRVEK